MSSALAHPNIAFIKYWGNRDASLRLPSNGSISMNLEGLFTRTRVEFLPGLDADTLTLNGSPVTGTGLQRIASFLDHVRRLAGLHDHARVVSENNFPAGAGIASSASAFAALALAASHAASLDLSEPELSRLARFGSGSASRSVPGGFVEWQTGTGDSDSFAFSIASPHHWLLADCVAVVNAGQKPVGSTEGHALASTSPLQSARVEDTPRRLDLCRGAVMERDFAALASVIELDSDMMHAVMMTSSPPLHYWQPASLAVMQAVRLWRKAGFPAAYTLDAGPNVHVICPADHAPALEQRLLQVPGVMQVLSARPGGPACILPEQE